MSFLAFIKNGKKVKNNFMPAKYPASRVSYNDNGTETDVQAKVSELNADITNVSIPVNINKIKIYKKLGITQVILTGLDYTTASSFTVPDGYRPRSTLTVVGSNYTGSALDIVLVTIETNGDIIVQNNTGAVITNYTAVTCSFNYIS